MIEFNDETGLILIEFPNNLLVTLRPPTYGGFKRVRRERERLNEAAHAQVAALPEIPEAGETEGVDDAPTRARLGRERVVALEEINLAAAEQFWRFVLCGDDTFKGLADPLPPVGPPGAEFDDWPADLLYDTHNALTELGLIDRVFASWGKARSRSGVKAS